MIYNQAQNKKTETPPKNKTYIAQQQIHIKSTSKITTAGQSAPSGLPVTIK